MKKNYQKPEVRTACVDLRTHLLGFSNNVGLKYSGAGSSGEARVRENSMWNDSWDADE